MDRNTAAQKIVEICKRLHNRNLLAACDGNVSVRLSDNTILITPTAMNKGFISTKDLAVITLDNKVLEGNPSGERLMHLEVFKKCPKAVAVVHAHPPTAIAWTVAKPELTELPNDCLSEIILAVGTIPIAPYARPGTINMGEVLHPYLPQSRVMLLARHGALSWGESIEEAYDGMERLEHSAQILKSAVELGGIHPLPKEEITILKQMRKEMGETTR